jgi:hypothetical protein
MSHLEADAAHHMGRNKADTVKPTCSERVGDLGAVPKTYTRLGSLRRDHLVTKESVLLSARHIIHP